MRYPHFLPEGGTIGFAAPSFGCATEPYRTAFENAQKNFRAMGYDLLLGPNVYAADGTGISSAPERCAEEWMSLYESSGCDILLSCGGGELMCEILPYLDPERIRSAAPKWFMGYSDNTNLTYLLTTMFDVASVYGPCAPAFGMQPWHEAIGHAMKLLQGQELTQTGYDLYEAEPLKSETNPLAPYHTTEPRRTRVFNAPDGDESSVDFSGRLIGGCVDCLVNLTGTRFDYTHDFLERYREDGFIWFLETCDLNVFAIRRAFWQMEQAGWFEHVRGFMIGRPLAGQEDLFGLDHFRAVTDVIGHLGVPILMDVDLGHIPPMMPLITGSLAHVSLRGQDISAGMTLA